MYQNKSVCVVIPAHNETTQILRVLSTLPEWVDHIVVVDDASTDATADVVTGQAKKDGRVVLLRHDVNQGCGGALVSGYRWAIEHHIDIAVRMDGDGQMDPADLPALVEPVASGAVDYTKGNRFFSGNAYRHMPKIRYFGTAFLSLLTKIVSGYWHISDFQSGYTAISNKALNTIDWDRMYKQYGQPNDLMILLNVDNFRVADVPVEPVYNVGEKSGIRIKKVVFTISWLLFKRFFWRMKEKYIIKDFHPLVFFYLLGMGFGALTAGLFARLFYIWYISGYIPPINALAAMFSFMSASQFILFAMWFDMEANKDLKSESIKR
ncbi:glycosyltransferase family 2 protein [Desulfosudis oleivorans]|uniref:Glycosyl transferase family 2 n=1 Tax=Desulfosudis oleivorans (strain DSM 6200 / JCM 39069 / Hxd3) TaxID=96561 RepID=A8ZU33_DESOH|nr:glycosyltransferase family 2 protein [Desulfosudis oleivorans]ABW66345.1 glycosyl transferase family 2 [Desulfosudis oleivorans Hxd3]